MGELSTEHLFGGVPCLQLTEPGPTLEVCAAGAARSQVISARGKLRMGARRTRTRATAKRRRRGGG